MVCEGDLIIKTMEIDIFYSKHNIRDIYEIDFETESAQDLLSKLNLPSSDIVMQFGLDVSKKPLSPHTPINIVSKIDDINAIRLSAKCKFIYDCRNLFTKLSDQDLLKLPQILQDMVNLLATRQDKDLLSLEVFTTNGEITENPLREFLLKKLFPIIKNYSWSDLIETLELYELGGENDDVKKFCSKMSKILKENIFIQNEMAEELAKARMEIDFRFDPANKLHFKLYYEAKISGKDEKYQNSNVKLIRFNDLEAALDTVRQSREPKRAQYMIYDIHSTVFDVLYDPTNNKFSCVVMDSVDGLDKEYQAIFLKKQCKVFLCKSNEDGLKMQHDWSSCDYFSTHFATQAAKTPDLHKIAEASSKQRGDINILPWSCLESRFVKHSQSQQFLDANTPSETKIPKSSIAISEHFSSKVKTLITTQTKEGISN